MSNGDVRALATDFYQALLAGDIDRASAYLADDLVLREAGSLPFGGVHHGRENFFKAVGGAGELIDLNDLKLEHLLVDGDRVAVLVAIRSRLNADAGQQYCIDWVTFRDGKVVELMPFYWDTAALLGR